METQVIHLFGRRFSGRAVKCRELSVAEMDAVYLLAARTSNELPEADRKGAFAIARTREGLKRFVIAISEPLEDGVAVNSPDVAWTPVSVEHFETVKGWGTYFNTRETQVIEKAFSDIHDVGVSEVAAILGKSVILAT